MDTAPTTGAASRSHRGRREAGSPGRGAARLLLAMGFIGPGLVGLGYQQLDYILVPYVCAGVRSPVWFHGTAVGALLLLAALGLLAFRDWRRTGGDLELQQGSYPAAAGFVSLVGVVFASFASLVVLCMWAAHFILDPCS